MSRPAPVKSDNIFLVLYQVLTLRRTPIVLRVVVHSLLLVGAALALCVMAAGFQLRQSMQEHTDAVGQSLVVQTAYSATTLLAVNDNLSLHVLLNNLVQNPLVSYAGIQSVDGRVLAEAGHTPRPNRSGEVVGQYAMPLMIQNASAGRLYVALDMNHFQQPYLHNQRNLGLFALALLAVILILSVRLGRQVSVPIKQMRQWLDDPSRPFPRVHQDELGGLFQQIRDHFPQEEEEEEPKSPILTEPDSWTPPIAPGSEPVITTLPPGLVLSELAAAQTQTKPSCSLVLAIQLGSAEQLEDIPLNRLQGFQQHYRNQLAQVARLYRAELHHLVDGSSLLLFHGYEHDLTQGYLTHALCCSELLRSLTDHLLSVLGEPKRTLTLHLALGRVSNGELMGKTQGDLVLNRVVQTTLDLMRQSHNLLLLAPDLAQEPLIRQRARLHPAVNPKGAYCVECLQAPYLELLGRQRTALLGAMS